MNGIRMAVFRFRLASVLRYRERIREEKRQELRTLEEAEEHLASEVKKLERILTHQTKELEEQRGKILSVVELRLQGDFTQRVVQRIKERRKLLATVHKKLVKKRDEVVQADRGVKSLEQLHHRFWERHRRQENTDEQKLVDEIGQRRYYDRKE